MVVGMTTIVMYLEFGAFALRRRGTAYRERRAYTGRHW